MKRRLALLAAVLVALIGAAVAASPAKANELAFSQFTRLTAADAGANLQAVLDDFAHAPAEADQVRAHLVAALHDGTGVQAVTFVLILIIVGAGLEWLYWTFAAAPLRAIVDTRAATPRQAAVLAFRRLVLLAFGLLLFTAATLSAALALPWPPHVDAMVIAATVLVVAVRGVWMIADVIVSPHHPSLRLAAIHDHGSGAVGGGAAWLTLLAATTVLLPRQLVATAAAAHLAGAIRVTLGGLIAVSLLAAVVVIFRRGRQDRGRHRRHPRFPTAFIAASVIVATAVLALVGGGRIAALLGDIVIVVALLAASKGIVFFFWRDNVASDQEPDTEHVPDMLPLIVLSVVRFATLLAGIAAGIAIAGVPLAALTSGTNATARFAVSLVDTAAVAFIAHLGWIAIRFAIDRRLDQLPPLDPHGPPTEATRLRTLLPLLRTTLAVGLIVLFALTALWTLGVQIAPLLAGAGIFGLAIGFGAQTLVRDVIAGVFFLIEDVFRIGEYIESGTNTRGTVEHISFRTVALRHHNGPLTFVPYGALGTVRNNSRDWVIDKFNIPLPLSVDSERIRKMVKRIGEDMVQDPTLGPLIREPLKTKLDRVEPGVKIFRCKFMTAPGHQFDVRAAALRRIETALGEAGVPFAGLEPRTILLKQEEAPAAPVIAEVPRSVA